MTTTTVQPTAPPTVTLAPLGRTMDLARPAARRIALATLLGAGAIAADIGLMGTAAWLISRAAQHPNEQALAVAIVLPSSSSASRAGSSGTASAWSATTPPSGSSPTSGSASTSAWSAWRRPGSPASAGATSWPGSCRTWTRCRTW